MVIKKFEEICAWQKSQDLAVLVYSEFKNLKDYNFKDQICRAAISISSNIAEGFERSSDADFARFLYISLGSCSELKSLIYLGNKLDYLSSEKSKNLIFSVSEISKMLQGFIKFLKNKTVD